MSEVLLEKQITCGASDPKIKVDLKNIFRGVSFREILGGKENMANNMENQKLVGSEVIAAIFGVTSRRVQQLTQDGIIVAKKEKGANKYDLLPTIQRYIKYLSEKANTRGEQKDDVVEKKRQQADADLKRSRADMAALQFKELDGKMHRSDDVEAVMTDMVFTVRSALLSLPGRLAVDVSETETAAEASQIIEAEVHLLLAQLAEYHYDPEEYAHRVREREGWREQPISEIDD